MIIVADDSTGTVWEYENDLHFLFWAVLILAEQPNFGQARLLLELGAPWDFHCRRNGEPYHRSILHSASCVGNVQVVHWALVNGADVNVVAASGTPTDTPFKTTPIYYAILHGHVEIVHLLLDTKKVDVEEIYLDHTLLQLAVLPTIESGVEIAKALVAAGADINVKFGNTHGSLLFLVQTVPMLDWLLSVGLGLYEVCDYGKTPIDHYIHCKLDNLLDYLSRRGLIFAPKHSINTGDLMPTTLHLPFAIANKDAPFIFHCIKAAVGTGVIQSIGKKKHPSKQLVKTTNLKQGTDKKRLKNRSITALDLRPMTRSRTVQQKKNVP